MTLRTRLVIIVAALVGLGLAMGSIITYRALENFLLDRVDEQLANFQPLALRILEEGDLPPPSPNRTLPVASMAEVRDENGNVENRIIFGFDPGDPVYEPNLPNQLPNNEPFSARATDNRSYRFRVLAGPLADGRILIVAIPLEEMEGTLNRLLLIEAIVAACLLTVTAGGAWWLVRRELHGLEQMADAAARIADGDLAQRIEVDDPRTEVGTLGQALNSMLEHIQGAFEVQRESEERLRRFLADASHELRTPLTSIRGYAELFRRGADERPEDLKLAMRRIEDEAARMGVLVEDLLLLARVDQTRPLEMKPIDLSAIVTDAAADARTVAADRVIGLKVPGPLVVRGDDDRIRQAVSNLVSNAISHTDPAAPIELEVSSKDGTAVITVSDAGEGLDEETLEHAFERFWRADPNRARSSGGVGLGLAIVDAIARAHGGTVSAENRPEGGARFSIHLPVTEAEAGVTA